MTLDPVEPMPRRPLGPSPEEERGLRRALAARNLLAFLLTVLVLGLLAVNAYTAVLIRSTQIPNTQRAKDSAATLDAVKDCTTPGRECYERGQRQTAGAVNAISQGNQAAAAAAAACAANLDEKTYARILACMNLTLKP